jgi:hypothetical protein
MVKWMGRSTVREEEATWMVRSRGGDVDGEE